jgi:signal transduction histidine kinase
VALLFVLLTLPAVSSFASPNLDSLWSVWRNREFPDSSRLKAIYDLSWDGYIYTRPDSTLILAQLMLELAQSKAYPKWEVKAFNAIASAHWVLGNYDQALAFYQKQLRLNKELKDSLGIAKTHNNMALVLQDQGNFEAAKTHHEESLAIKKVAKDTNGIAKSYNNLGIVYNRMGHFTKALEMFQQSLALRSKNSHQREIANTYNNIGNVYWEQKDYEQTLHYYNLGLEIFAELDDKKGLSEVTTNIGGAYLDLKNYHKALEFLHQSVDLNKQVGNKNGLAMSLFNLGMVAYAREDYPTTQDYLSQSLNLYQQLNNKLGLAETWHVLGMLALQEKDLSLAQQNCEKGYAIAQNIKTRSVVKDCLECLYEIAKAQKDFPRALAFHEEYLALNDTLFNIENAKKIGQLELKFQHEQEKAQIQQQLTESKLEAQLQQEKLKRTNYLTIAGLIGLMLLILYLLITRSNRQLKSKNKELYYAQKQTMEQNKALQAYIKSNTQLENFALTASHDLKAPIRSIINFSQLLQAALPDNSEDRLKEYLDMIIVSSRNMKQLIEDLLTYSKVNSTGINVVEVNPRNLLRSMLYDIQSVINEKKANVELLNFPENIRADKIKLKQVLQNLILNAVKFVDPNVQPMVSIECLEQDQNWLFSVKDNGIGIDQRYHQEIFDSFRRLHSKHQYEGSGLGLSVCKKVVEQHRGKIWLSSEPGHGTAFFFTIDKFLN